MPAHWTIGKKLILSFLGIAFIILLSMLYFKSTIDAIRIKGPLYQQIIDSKDLIADILPPPAFIIESYLCAMEVATAEEDAGKREQLLGRLKELAEGTGYFQERIKFWETTLTDANIRSVFLQEATQQARSFYTTALGPFATAVRGNQMETARQIFHQQLKPSYVRHRQAIDKVVTLANDAFSAQEARAQQLLGKKMLTMALIAGALVTLSLVMGILIARSISRPITAGVRILEEVAQGDMLQTIPPELCQRGDEVGQMALSLHKMVTQLGGMIREIVTGVHQLTASSGELNSISGQLLDSSRETTEKSASVATAAEEMTSNMQSVSAATEQSSTNVALIADSTERMISTIHDIAHSADSARVISADAVLQAQLASEKMASLGDSARNIGRVTETITEISEQTNLLALNATIEAARAGEAGKGFAVVANEIKELAKQTANATVNIKHQIEEMQSTTAATVADIGTIAKVIEQINSMISGIATAVDAQATTSQEIASNIAQASQGIGEINHNVASSTAVITEVTREITNINQQSGYVEAGSSRVRESAVQLNQLAAQLEQLVQKFRV